MSCVCLVNVPRRVVYIMCDHILLLNIPEIIQVLIMTIISFGGKANVFHVIRDKHSLLITALSLCTHAHALGAVGFEPTFSVFLWS